LANCSVKSQNLEVTKHFPLCDSWRGLLSSACFLANSSP
jgi:hypothetical protein